MNLEAILQEVEVLQSIYPDEIKEHFYQEELKSYVIIFSDDLKGVVIQFTVTEGYPEQPKSLAVIITQSYNRRKDLESKAQDIFRQSLGEVCLYKIIEEVRSAFESPGNYEINNSPLEDEECDLEAEEEITSTDYESASGLQVIHGPITTEMKSSFQGHLAEVHSMADVHTFKRIVLSNKKVARATHNIFAYRFVDDKTKITHHDCDDDGETAAGARLAEMMRLMGVQNVAVIVSRWFGGILLGPDRFKFICNSAKDLLEDCGYGDHRTGGGSKHQKKK